MSNHQIGLGRSSALRAEGDYTAAANGDWVEVDRLSRGDLLGQVDTAFCSYLGLYESRCSAMQPPSEGGLTTEDLVASGLGKRLVELNVDDVAKAGGLLLPGQCFEFKTQPKDAALLGHRLCRHALSRVLVNVCLTWQPQYFSITGRLGTDFLYLHAAALPLRGEEGEITHVLMPFISKLGEVPAGLREEFFTRHVEHP